MFRYVVSPPIYRICTLFHKADHLRRPHERMVGPRLGAPLPASQPLLRLAERIRASVVAEPMVAHTVAEPVRVTVSCGVAGSLEAPYEPEPLIALADAALFHAKRDGRDRVSVA